MGLFIFVEYINDLPDGLENVIKMYADDSKVISDVDEFLTDIYKIKAWCMCSKNVKSFWLKIIVLVMVKRG